MSICSKAVRILLLAITFAVFWTLNPYGLFGSGSVVSAATGSFSGTVTYHDGTLLSGATVTTTKTSDESTAEATTDSSGAFTITGLAAGSDYAVTASYSTTTADLSSTNLTNQTIASDATLYPP